ncbi:DUF6924 domain-containing protein [Actinophytocola gossypii]|uniref:DUF6924 domain-containing protein n=1 Tax=Actinophytocola gossypii TaxID=2812003 RepID=A0ABT2JAP6_9PSEU|nr:hypothetical protein [Actinophytocola gossypii]MCT2584364.1 hypothetical protein [Actinophytocola gossypii]
MPSSPLPRTENPLLVRTDFTDDAAWAALPAEVDDEYVTYVADPAHRDLTPEDLLSLLPPDHPQPVLVVADATTFAGDDHPLLAVDVRAEPGRTFRVAADAVRSVVGNLSIDNLTFDDYLDSVGEDGVHRLHPRHVEALAALRGDQPPTP